MQLLLFTSPSTARVVEPGLTREGLKVQAVDRLEQAEVQLFSQPWDAVLIDQQYLARPAADEVSRWRCEGVHAHVIVVLPERSNGSDRAACYDAGADVCLDHPLNLLELKAHLRALERRAHTIEAPVLRIHDLVINTAQRSVARAGRAIQLTMREYDLLRVLASRPGKVFSRSMILQLLYSEEGGVDPGACYSNVVDVYIRYLRKKIDEGFDKRLILTRWGQGYLLRAEE